MKTTWQDKFGYVICPKCNGDVPAEAIQADGNCEWEERESK